MKKLAIDGGELARKDPFPKWPIYGKEEDVLKNIKDLTGETPSYSCELTERLSENEVLWITQSVLMADEKAMHDIAEGIDKVLATYY